MRHHAIVAVMLRSCVSRHARNASRACRVTDCAARPRARRRASAPRAWVNARMECERPSFVEPTSPDVEGPTRAGLRADQLKPRGGPERVGVEEIQAAQGNAPRAGT